METYPIVPEGLEKDLTSDHELVIRYNDKCGQRQELRSTVMDSHRRVRIVLRPFIEVEETNPRFAAEGEPEVAVTTIPLESVASIDVDDFVHQGYDTESGEVLEEEIPVSRWVRHPDEGLLRFAAK